MGGARLTFRGQPAQPLHFRSPARWRDECHSLFGPIRELLQELAVLYLRGYRRAPEFPLRAMTTRTYRAAFRRPPRRAAGQLAKPFPDWFPGRGRRQPRPCRKDPRAQPISGAARGLPARRSLPRPPRRAAFPASNQRTWAVPPGPAAAVGCRLGPAGAVRPIRPGLPAWCRLGPAGAVRPIRPGLSGPQWPGRLIPGSARSALAMPPAPGPRAGPRRPATAGTAVHGCFRACANPLEA